MQSSQRALLTLVRHVQSLDEERLMALACLLRAELLPADAFFYDFLRVEQRPWSFTLHHDLGKLATDRWLTCSDGTIAPGPRLAAPSDTLIQGATWSLADVLPSWWRSVRRLSMSALRQRISVSDEGPKAGGTPGITQDEPVVMTAGYQGVSLESFLTRLLHAGVRLLIDVRANPTARRFGFHRSTLARCCPQIGICYEHVPDLGIKAEHRDGKTTPAQRQRLFRDYVQRVKASRSPALARVTAWMRDVPAVLVCLEADPLDCHRTYLGRMISDRLERPLMDLGEAAQGVRPSSRPVRHRR